MISGGLPKRLIFKHSRTENPQNHALCVELPREAYDAFHLHLYIQEIIESRRTLLEMKSGLARFSWEICPRPDRALFLMLDIFLSRLLNVSLTKTELGGSLLEIIDGYQICLEFLELTEPYMESPYKRSKYIEPIEQWISIETAPLFGDLCRILHPDYKIKAYESINDFKNEFSLGSTKSLFDRAVSSYAFSETFEYANFISLFDLACVQILGFLEEQVVVQDPIGTEMVYFNLRLLNEILTEKKTGQLRYFYGSRRPSRPKNLINRDDCIEAFFIYSKNHIPLQTAIQGICRISSASSLLANVRRSMSKSETLKTIGIQSILHGATQY
jgi:hypothetical protein